VFLAAAALIAGMLLAMATATTATAATTTITGSASGRCVDVPGGSRTNGTQIELWDCNGGSNQSFTYTSAKLFQVYGSKCLDANGTGAGAKVQIGRDRERHLDRAVELQRRRQPEVECRRRER
jgi:hypothetical protein